METQPPAKTEVDLFLIAIFATRSMYDLCFNKPGFAKQKSNHPEHEKT